ncbi:hypothetical protein WT83_27380 [Burkholderia territorii]|uniref:Uncharacterized protein n=2 Tax=Burkholderia territorii TaxID=1503055 RepID=A0A125K426_9BURK|nr:hypothetical protein WT83_27380 [Burkholderia territorii]
MLLFCPKCGEQHVDAPEEREYDAGLSTLMEVSWTNPPHRSHLCHACQCVWRPADVATVGVATIETHGTADTWTVEQGSIAVNDLPATGRRDDALTPEEIQDRLHRFFSKRNTTAMTTVSVTEFVVELLTTSPPAMAAAAPIDERVAQLEASVRRYQTMVDVLKQRLHDITHPDVPADERAAFSEWVKTQDNGVTLYAAYLHGKARPAALPAAEAVAYRVLRRNTVSGEWVTDGRHWCDGAPSADLLAETAGRADEWRVEIAVAAAAAAQPAQAGAPTTLIPEPRTAGETVFKYGDNGVCRVALTDERIRAIENEQAKIPSATRDSLTIRTVPAILADRQADASSEAHESVPSLTNPLTPFGMLVRSLRIVSGTLLGDMAKHLGCSSAMLSAVEFGRTPLTDAMIADTAAYFSSVGIPDTLHALSVASRARAILDGADQ